MDQHLQQGVIFEATRYLHQPQPIARQWFGARVARAFELECPGERARALDFNARLATELRELAGRKRRTSIWGDA